MVDAVRKRLCYFHDPDGVLLEVDAPRNDQGTSSSKVEEGIVRRSAIKARSESAPLKVSSPEEEVTCVADAHQVSR